MNIHELSSRTNISLSNLRKLERLGVLTVDAEPELAPALRFHLGRHAQLSVAQILDILAAPDVLEDLGRYAIPVRAQIAALGNVKAAPREVTAAIFDAGKGDPEACEIIGTWLRDVLPADPVSYYWIAVRLLYGLPETLKSQYTKRLNIALANVRKLDSFAGWYHMESAGAVRNTVRYHKPRLALDL